jgi:hypothetical protein
MSDPCVNALEALIEETVLTLGSRIVSEAGAAGPAAGIRPILQVFAEKVKRLHDYESALAVVPGLVDAALDREPG